MYTASNIIFCLTEGIARIEEEVTFLEKMVLGRLDHGMYSEACHISSHVSRIAEVLLVLLDV